MIRSLVPFASKVMLICLKVSSPESPFCVKTHVFILFRKCEVVDAGLWPRVLRSLCGGLSGEEAAMPHLQGGGQEGRAQAALHIARAHGGDKL